MALAWSSTVVAVSTNRRLLEASSAKLTSLVINPGQVCPASSSVCNPAATQCGLYSRPLTLAASAPWACDELWSTSGKYVLRFVAGKLAVVDAKRNEIVWNAGYTGAPPAAIANFPILQYALLPGNKGTWDHRINVQGTPSAWFPVGYTSVMSTGRVVNPQMGVKNAPFTMELRDNGILVVRNKLNKTAWTSSGPEWEPCTKYVVNHPQQAGGQAGCACVCPNNAINIWRFDYAFTRQTGQTCNIVGNATTTTVPSILDWTGCMRLPEQMTLFTDVLFPSGGVPLAIGRPAGTFTPGTSVTQELWTEDTADRFSFKLVASDPERGLMFTPTWLQIRGYNIRTSGDDTNLCVGVESWAVGAPLLYLPCDPIDQRQSWIIATTNHMRSVLMVENAEQTTTLCATVPGQATATGTPMRLAKCYMYSGGASSQQVYRFGTGDGLPSVDGLRRSLQQTQDPAAGQSSGAPAGVIETAEVLKAERSPQDTEAP
ncbi:hypothetical protein HYH03_007945 [Edaphochlamys debaryana]|uniref:Bulb-type lectin domain-containing protein n=1 Tax=Edaphochlamys debaryana TaxID=47281 RepID=A0A836C025_9CHLO|nr:hypothetical protein HYH03_007945 [Edaphochlamys debaryana]|eukprot:KAG2494019.1 hypothetical protein HYH03_007945 [Edaphochlamys debaryana]